MSRLQRSGFLILVLAHVLALLPFQSLAADPIQVSIPPSPSSNNVVFSNFLGISIELSFVDQYFGNDTSTIPQVVINYLAALRSRTVDKPLRLRIGGNSMDSSTYVPTQTSPMIQLTNPQANANNQPVNFGPMLWDVMKQVATNVGGADYLIGLSLLDPNSTNVPLLAGAAEQTLGNDVDAFLLGNEPDLYTAHGNRPNIANYTVQDYIGEYSTVAGHLTNTSAGNILQRVNLAGPTICCDWDLATLIQEGYIAAFNNILKYITLQHYPQNNCFGTFQFDLPYYLQHANVVGLASWQQPGINMVLSNTSTNHPEMVMSEFNSASCGGIPGISNTFGVGTLWTIDYALQMASVGYSAAYLHTRERGISYNLFTPPVGADGNNGSWVTNPPYYALLTVAEALESKNGSIVADLNLANSKTDLTAIVSAYAIYDANDHSLQRIVLFNYANVSSATTPFTLPANFTKSSNITVKYLTAPSVNETTNIAWGGQTLAGVGDGKLVSTTNGSTAAPNQQMDCTNGCTINVPGPGLAVLMVSGQISEVVTTNGTTSSSKSSSPTSGSSTSGSKNGPTVPTNSPTSGAVGWYASTGLMSLFFAAITCLLY